ncbi:MAG TPA: OpgC domain-containing protein [Thermomicrobiales bacterium]|jgi:hypothetical protein
MTIRATAEPSRFVPALQRRLETWRYEGGKRDLRFDLLRGFAVFAMVVDHVGGDHSPLYYISGGDRFFVSAAEAFVFLSGLLMGMVNGGLLRRGDVGGALRKVLGRAGMLYAITVGLTLVTAALPLVLGFNWAPKIGDLTPLQYIVGILTFHYAAYLTDIPFLYTMLVLAAEPVLLLLDRGYTRFVLAASGGLWFAWQIAPDQAIVWPPSREALFQFSSWQFLFIIALSIGFHRRTLERFFRAAATPTALIISAIGMVGALALLYVNLAPLVALTGVDAATLTDWFFYKQDVGAGRLVAFVILITFAFALVSVFWRLLSHALGWLLLPLGQNSLSAYVIHVFVVGLLAWARPHLFQHETSYWKSAVLQLVGVILVWTVIRVRPFLAVSLEGLDSIWKEPLPTSAETTHITAPGVVSVDVAIAQAQATRDVTFLR